MFSIATWNVNSLRVRLPHVLDWLAEHKPDLLALQEIKLTDERFPTDEIKAAGYHAVFSGQKTYNGIAILSRTPSDNHDAGIPGYADPQQRVLAADYGPVCLL
ncbi:MAG: endonuclease/exonuclease/phosphatase family protein, partial [Thiotrichales bacterium]|nr:endonuclease/exonuclease/phosphatase family protein [Thiotrichales bacterium]